MGQWTPRGEWIYDNQTRQVRSNKINKCVVTDGKSLYLESCDDNATAQKWTWKETYLT